MTDNNLHETYRNAKTARRAQDQGREVAARGPWNLRNSSNGRGISQLCWTLERCVRQRWETGTGKQAAPFTPMQAFQETTTKASKLLLKGPKANGYKTDLWTLRRIAQVIEKHFGESYGFSGVWYLLSRIGWSCQKPERRAGERNDQAIAVWKKRGWPHIKKVP